jgi:hypothetical protein
MILFYNTGSNSRISRSSSQNSLVGRRSKIGQDGAELWQRNPGTGQDAWSMHWKSIIQQIKLKTKYHRHHTYFWPIQR